MLAHIRNLLFIALVALSSCKPATVPTVPEPTSDRGNAPLLSASDGLGFFCTFNGDMNCFCKEERTDDFWTCEGFEEKCRWIGGKPTPLPGGVWSCGASIPQSDDQEERWRGSAVGSEDLEERSKVLEIEGQPTISEHDVKAHSAALAIVSGSPEPTGWCQGNGSQTKCSCVGSKDCESMDTICDIFVGGEICCTKGDRQPQRCECISGYACSSSGHKPK